MAIGSQFVKALSMPPINEKTVELNLTAEFMRTLSLKLHRRVAVWAPTLRQEAKLGFDAMLQAAGFAMLIQYKSAAWHPGSGEWRFKINETAKQDQHKRLCGHANSGIRTRYALPLFDQFAVVEQHVMTGALIRMPLLLLIDPRKIRVPKGGVGKHTLGVFGRAPYTRTLRSDPIVSDHDDDDGIEKLVRDIEERGPPDGGGEPPDDFGDDGGSDDSPGTGLVGFYLPR